MASSFEIELFKVEESFGLAVLCESEEGEGEGGLIEGLRVGGVVFGDGVVTASESGGHEGFIAFFLEEVDKVEIFLD